MPSFTHSDVVADTIESVTSTNYCPSTSLPDTAQPPLSRVVYKALLQNQDFVIIDSACHLHQGLAAEIQIGKLQFLLIRILRYLRESTQ